MEVVVTFLEGNPDNPLITGVVPNKTTPVPYALPANKSKTVLRSRSTPDSGGYNELSIEDRAGQEKIYLRAQRDIEQLILNDSDTQIGNDRREQIIRDSHSLIGNDRFDQVDSNSSSLVKGDELHTTQGVRNTQIGGNELLSISGNGSITVGGTWVVQAGPQARVTATHVVVDASTSLTLKAGGQHIVITPGGSSAACRSFRAEPRWQGLRRNRPYRHWPRSRRPALPIRWRSLPPPGNALRTSAHSAKPAATDSALLERLHEYARTMDARPG